ncbi:MAG: D-alanyl-D-alanine carboxypeptidase/D-alanyl-D-alanine-endopeptidase [Acidobacteria bacterium]|nr:D-alanyl-D-alanine carboxypeptidase/D-alanyl-D-alanine-endopeptidase [Acidobacteriota bacterium]
MTGRLSAAVLLLGLTLACHRTPAPATPAPPPPPPSSARTHIDALRTRVNDLLADPAVAAGTWGVSVRSLSTHEPLVEVNAHRLLTPASTLKTITLAVTADQLGWDHAFETRVVSTGTISNGVLYGDLVVIGSGDPSFDDWDGTASAVFGSWAMRLRELGVTMIGGRIIGDDRVFSGDGYGAGWMWDDMAESYSAPASGLQFNQGTAQIVVSPGASVGAPAVLTFTPPFARVTVVNRAATVASGDATRVVAKPQAGAPGTIVSGTVATDAVPQKRNVAVANPTLYYATALYESLQGRGIQVTGGPVDVDDLPNPPAIASATPLLVHRSPALPSLADTLMKLSQNLYAETFLRTLGRQQGEQGTASAGIAVVKRVLDGWGVSTQELVMADGSGLSRYNLVTPALVVSVLEHVYADDRLRAPYVASLPIAGQAGTLAARMKGTAAEGRVQAKTGSFTNARAIAGFVRTADGEVLAFDIMANNYGVPAAEVDRVTDAVVIALAEFRR